jgi:putative ABC transport system ATP-binding protein
MIAKNPLPMEGTLVRLTNVSKTYRLDAVDVAALTGVTLFVRADSFTVIAGPSGSGKTTLLNLMGCVDRADQGEIEVAGVDVNRLSDDELSDFRAHHLGYVFQTFNLLPVLTAFENVEYPLAIGGMSPPQRRRRVTELLEAVGLAEKARHRPGQLSGGQRQRVAIARALATQPRMVLADEPTANLDSQTGREIIELMRNLQQARRTSFVFSSHDPQLLSAADDVIRISDGRITRVERASANRNIAKAVLC